MLMFQLNHEDDNANEFDIPMSFNVDPLLNKKVIGSFKEINLSESILLPRKRKDKYNYKLCAIIINDTSKEDPMSLYLQIDECWFYFEEWNIHICKGTTRFLDFSKARLNIKNGFCLIYSKSEFICNYT